MDAGEHFGWRDFHPKIDVSDTRKQFVSRTFLVVNEKFENFSLFTFFDPKFEGLKINDFPRVPMGTLETGRN